MAQIVFISSLTSMCFIEDQRQMRHSSADGCFLGGGWHRGKCGNSQEAGYSGGCSLVRCRLNVSLWLRKGGSVDGQGLKSTLSDSVRIMGLYLEKLNGDMLLCS